MILTAKLLECVQKQICLVYINYLSFANSYSNRKGNSTAAYARPQIYVHFCWENSYTGHNNSVMTVFWEPLENTIAWWWPFGNNRIAGVRMGMNESIMQRASDIHSEALAANQPDSIQMPTEARRWTLKHGYVPRDLPSNTGTVLMQD